MKYINKGSDKKCSDIYIHSMHESDHSKRSHDSTGASLHYITFSHLADAFVQSDVQGREQSSYKQ